MSISVETLRKELEAISDVQDEATLITSVSRLNQLASQDDNLTWQDGTEACKSLADALRSASLRTPLGNAQLIECLSSLLQKASGQQVDFQVQALRILGNLCFDNEENRKRVKDAGIIPIVSTWFASNRKDLIRTMCGFYLNSSMNYAPIQIELAECGAAAHLIDMVKYDREDDGTITMAIKVIDNLVEEETARKIIATPTTVKTYLDFIQDLYTSEEYMDELDNLENVCDSLLQIVMDDDNLQNEIIHLNKLNLLADFLENTTAIVCDKEEKEQLEEVRKTVSKIAIYATSSDSKMNELYNDQALLSRFLKMASSDDEVVHQFAAYALGNLARSDEHCIELVEKYDLSKLLLNLYQQTENATFQYAILGCLKHLCLPVTNKIKIGNEDCIRILTSVLDESKDMLKRNQFLTIGIIKLLCAGNFDNAVRVVNEDTLESVIAFITRVDDVAAKSEASRILTNLVKSIWVEQDTLALKKKITDTKAITLIVNFVREATHPVLKNDGIMALTIIFDDAHYNPFSSGALPSTFANPPATTSEQTEEEGAEKPESRSFLQVVIDDICSEKSELPVQIKCNTCILLLKIVQAARSAQEQDIVNTIQSSAMERLEAIQDTSELYKYAHALLSTLKQ